MALEAAAQIVNVTMSYLALARKWRPRTFSQLVGQDHINQALINSLNQQRLHHAYLFTGTRGVGKTSIARLMAKSLNCEQGVSADPCLTCDACLSIEQGRFIDLIEVDAASKTRVEDTRELLDNIQYAPTNGRFKIYLIDEVHMLSQHSFNALLKTLEEPPEHVKFLLATTDPQKLPVTVLSRCLQFNLKNLQPDIIAKHLQYVVDEEQQVCEPDALDLLAKAADGSMRDALSLLDQVIASVDKVLTVQQVKATLGYTQQDYALQLIKALVAQDAPSIIPLSRKIACEGGHFRYVLNEMLDYLHQITLCHSLPDEHPLLKTNPGIRVLSEQISQEDTQLFYQIALKGMDEMYLAPTLTIGFEMTLMRMLTFRPAAKAKHPPLAHESIAAVLTKQPENVIKVIPPKPEFVAVVPAVETSQPEEYIKDKKLRQTVVATEIHHERAFIHPETEDNTDAPWETVLPLLKLTGLAMTAMENAEFIAKNGRNITLRVDKGHQSLFTTAVTQRIEQSLARYYGEAIKIDFNTDSPAQSTPAQKKQLEHDLQQESAITNLQNDAFLQQLQQEFSAELVKNSIVPVKDPL